MRAMGTVRNGLVALIFVLTSIFAHAETEALIVKSEFKAPLKFTLTELKTMPTLKIKAKDHDGNVAEYEGVALSEILRQAGVPKGELLRGDALQLCVLVKAADNYKAVFSLAELDPLFADKQVVLVYRRNGAELDAASGPLRLVIPEEKRQARWVRQVIELEIIRVSGKAKP